MIQTHNQFWSCRGWGISDKEVEIFKIIPKFNLYLQWWPLLKYWDFSIWFFNLVDNLITLTLKFIVYYLTYIRRLTYLEISEIGVLIFLNIAMFVVNKTDVKIGKQNISP